MSKLENQDDPSKISFSPHNTHKKGGNRFSISAFPCAPLGARTLDPNIKSVVLYQLS